MRYQPLYLTDVIEQLNTTISTFVFEFGGVVIEARNEEEARALLTEHILRIGVDNFVRTCKVHVTDEHPF